MKHKKIISAVALIIFGAVGRYLLKDIPNIETITVVTLLAGSLLGGVWTVMVGLAVVGVTDIFIGNTSILIYTWSAWSVMGFFGYIVRRRAKKPGRHALELTGMGLLGTLFFFLWTNLGVWHIGGLYPHTWQGLIDCYIAALPFLRNSLLSTLLFVPSISVIAITLWNRIPQGQRALSATTSLYGNSSAK